MAVVREDTVKLTFSFNDQGVSDANDAIEDMVKNTQKLGGSAEDAGDGFDSARKSAQKLAGTNFGKIVSGLDAAADKAAQIALKIGSIAIKGLTTGVVAGTTAFAGLATQAVKGYAEYEQLVGGVETLFGTGGKNLREYADSVGKSMYDVTGEYNALMRAQATVLQNADKAWQTAGLSANDYMNTVTSFSASLIQSVGGDTAEAAKIADQALVDMADNANKLGSDMSSIQNAYQGFAKQNYTINSIVCYMSDRIVSVCEPCQGCGIQARQEMAA